MSVIAVPRQRIRVGGFWAVAFAFAVVMGFTTIPTPLWPIYQQRDGFSSLTVTVVFAAYAVGVAVSLFAAGHLSDWHGRRRVLLTALAFNVAAAAIFLVSSALPALLLARVLSGLGVGVATATATAWLAELEARDAPQSTLRRAQLVATAANLGGFAAGALLGGALAQWVAQPLVVPFAVSLALLLAGIVLVALTPETRPPLVPRPAYRPQRVVVPSAARGRYLAAAAATLLAFAALGLFSSLTGTFLAQTLHQRSHLLAGAVAAAVFGSAVAAQLATIALPPRRLVVTGLTALPLGLALAVAGVWLPSPSLALFLAGGVAIGAGAGLLFKGALATGAALAPDESRAEALAGLFLAGYVGLAGPVVGLGLLTQLVSMRLSLLLFAAALAAAVALVARPLLSER
ncbi:MFS transporter [Conexibacter sp. JD483]|uniref:MFS transporter n=1 Tax=unclassified Conexibacter TaxID=2627773 RepID=UPI0027219EC2|nr:MULTISPECIES: MFS transporter [unclassified Conexibacter]MDO8187292.1 MFS transporter [Conexibacter sp. CPCC 205706]MDO8198901.1 MFS transporter [Conexibacter sp. CPCC 205762]MDR9370640.1 MFS transporter [Conexibacter sp. JD483]